MLISIIFDEYFNSFKYLVKMICLSGGDVSNNNDEIVQFVQGKVKYHILYDIELQIHFC